MKTDESLGRLERGKGGRGEGGKKGEDTMHYLPGIHYLSYG